MNTAGVTELTCVGGGINIIGLCYIKQTQISQKMVQVNKAT